MINYYKQPSAMKVIIDSMNLGPKFHTDSIYKNIRYQKRNTIAELYQFDIDENFETELVKIIYDGEASIRYAVDTITYDAANKDKPLYVCVQKESINALQELEKEHFHYDLKLGKGRRTDKFIFESVIEDFKNKSFNC